jgi:hypothetical protein
MTEPVLGWRIWKLGGGRLESWAVDYRWEPGENAATCLAPNHSACSSPPGTRCQCGFWGVWSPKACMSRAARAPTEPPWHVIGLCVGWGTVALHGREGFRAERAAVRCLFTDRPWSLSMGPAAFRPVGRWWRRALGVPPPSAPTHLTELESVAAHYAVPLVSLRGAAGLGLLSELGVPAGQIEEAAGLAGRVSAT